MAGFVATGKTQQITLTTSPQATSISVPGSDYYYLHNDGANPIFFCLSADQPTANAVIAPTDATPSLAMSVPAGRDWTMGGFGKGQPAYLNAWMETGTGSVIRITPVSQGRYP